MIDLSESSDFGFELISEDYGMFDEDEEDDDEYYWLDSQSIDEDNLISFLNEYYVIYPNKLPKPELI